MIALFGYGSLIYEPELPDALLDRVPARLPGYRRTFDLRSWRRGCPKADAHVVPGVPEGFVDGDLHLSLCLGTAPGDGIDGMLLVYPDDVEAELLRRTDQREGVSGDLARDRYVRERVSLGSTDAFVWLTNPASPHRVSLTLTEQARVLWHATPRSTCVLTRALGVHYLHGTREALAEHGVVDPDLEALAEEVDRVSAGLTLRITGIRTG